MKKFLSTAAAIAAMSFAANANAALVDFAAHADNTGERATTAEIINGVSMTFSATTLPGPVAANAYLDAGQAGLGVCKVVDAGSQCVPGSDDNITNGESVTITFVNGLQGLSGFVFRDEIHNLINPNLTLGVGINGGALVFQTFAQAIAAVYQNVSSITFSFGGANPDQYYLSAFNASTIPIPGALPLLLSGLAGLGFASRRKKSA